MLPPFLSISNLNQISLLTKGGFCQLQESRSSEQFLEGRKQPWRSKILHNCLFNFSESTFRSREGFVFQTKQGSPCELNLWPRSIFAEFPLARRAKGGCVEENYKICRAFQINTNQGYLIELSLLSKERKSHQIHILGRTDNMKHDSAPIKTCRRL